MKASRFVAFLLLPLRAFALVPLAALLNGCMNVGPNYSLPKDALVNAEERNVQEPPVGDPDFSQHNSRAAIRSVSQTALRRRYRRR